MGAMELVAIFSNFCTKEGNYKPVDGIRTSKNRD